MANKMADKKKNTNRLASAGSKARGKTLPVKSISEMAHDEKEAREEAKSDAKAGVKSTSTTTRNERKEVKEPVKQASNTSKSISAATSKAGTLRAERKAQDNKPVRRDTKEPFLLRRMRNNRVGRFVLDAYYELRHKVTWPTFEEARNMTVIVIILSVLIGLILGAVDFGLYYLFIHISAGGR